MTIPLQLFSEVWLSVVCVCVRNPQRGVQSMVQVATAALAGVEYLARVPFHSIGGADFYKGRWRGRGR
jgi:hypothetical protein